MAGSRKGEASGSGYPSHDNVWLLASYLGAMREEESTHKAIEAALDYSAGRFETQKLAWEASGARPSNFRTWYKKLQKHDDDAAAASEAAPAPPAVASAELRRWFASAELPTAANDYRTGAAALLLLRAAPVIHTST